MLRCSECSGTTGGANLNRGALTGRSRPGRVYIAETSRPLGSSITLMLISRPPSPRASLTASATAPA